MAAALINATDRPGRCSTYTYLWHRIHIISTLTLQKEHPSVGCEIGNAVNGHSVFNRGSKWTCLILKQEVLSPGGEHAVGLLSL